MVVEAVVQLGMRAQRARGAVAVEMVVAVVVAVAMVVGVVVVVAMVTAVVVVIAVAMLVVVAVVIEAGAVAVREEQLRYCQDVMSWKAMCCETEAEIVTQMRLVVQATWCVQDDAMATVVQGQQWMRGEEPRVNGRRRTARATWATH